MTDVNQAAEEYANSACRAFPFNEGERLMLVSAFTVGSKWQREQDQREIAQRRKLLCQEHLTGTPVCQDCYQRIALLANKSLIEKNARLREAATLVDYTDRSRGYPTPTEWEQVVRVARQALKEQEAKK